VRELYHELAELFTVSLERRRAMDRLLAQLELVTRRARAQMGRLAQSGEATGRGCPFGAMLNDQAGDQPAVVAWSPEAEARVERIPSFIRPMAKKAIERFAEAQGHPTITEAVMDEARGALGM